MLVTLPTALAYPAVMAAAAPFDPTVRLPDQPRRARGVRQPLRVRPRLRGDRRRRLASVWRAKRELREARRLHRYRLEALIGQGGMNEVWLARDEPLKRRIALKILRTDHGNAIAISRFEREARATSQLSSPHTIRIHDFGASDDGVYFIAMGTCGARTSASCCCVTGR
ncbi:MAG: hypothetical protein M5U28_04345 [Sandaracinaceae bacterium]|nr:hypothetical protein [Sandaracinaceae bacterium]